MIVYLLANTHDSNEDPYIFASEADALAFAAARGWSANEVQEGTVIDSSTAAAMIAEEHEYAEVETTIDVRERLEELRIVLRSESISWGELHELQGLSEHIEEGDVELLEAAGVPEFPDDEENRQPLHAVRIYFGAMRDGALERILETVRKECRCDLWISIPASASSPITASPSIPSQSERRHT